MKISIDVFKCFDGKSKEGKEYHLAQVRVPAGAGEVGTMFSDVSLEVEDDVEVDIQFNSNKQQNLIPRIKGLA